MYPNFNPPSWTWYGELHQMHPRSTFVLQEKANGGPLSVAGTPQLVPICSVPWLAATSSAPFRPEPLRVEHQRTCTPRPQPLRMEHQLKSQPKAVVVRWGHQLKSQPKAPKAPKALPAPLVRSPILLGCCCWSCHCLMKTGPRCRKGLPPDSN